MKILFVTATDIEAAAISRALTTLTPPGSTEIVVTGVGMVPAAWALMNHFATHGKPLLAINAGIGGTYGDEPAVGDVVLVERDCFADLGVDDRGRFVRATEAGLIAGGSEPFDSEGWIWCRNRWFDLLRSEMPAFSAVTSDTVSGSEERVKHMKHLYNPALETMEGASFFYICRLERVPFVAVRAISNRVEVRNRSDWQIDKALENLGERTEHILRLLTL